MFKKFGSPVQVNVIKFNKSAALEIKCSKCGASLGYKDGSVFCPAAGEPQIVTGPVKCQCGEECHV